MDQHPIAVDVGDLEMAHLRGAQTRAIADAESSPILEPGAGNGGQQIGHLLDAEDYGQFAGLAVKLHEPLHVFTSAGYTEKEAKRKNTHVERAGRHPFLGHFDLIRAQFLRRCRVWRPPEKRREMLHVADMGLLGLLG